MGTIVMLPMHEILIDVPVCNQRNLPPEWSWRGCAICSLWMLLKHHDSKLKISVMDLVGQGIAKDGYLEPVGWKHSAIVELAKDFGLELQYAKEFFHTPEEKESGLLIINRNLENGQPVMASVFRGQDSHIFVIHGFKESSSQLIGYYIQDPDGREYGHNYFITKEEFLNSWRGGLIYRY